MPKSTSGNKTLAIDNSLPGDVGIFRNNMQGITNYSSPPGRTAKSSDLSVSGDFAPRDFSDASIYFLI